MSKQLKHLKDQLALKGISSPEDMPVSGPIELPACSWGEISGGFGQVTFQQGFGQTVTYNQAGQAIFAQTYFLQGPQGPIHPAH
jgi:hypothetical protein